MRRPVEPTAAFYRLTAARLVQRHPAVVEPLRDGRLCFSSVVQLSKVLTSENESEVLPRYFHLSKREAKAVTAELRPAVSIPKRDVVTSVPSTSSAPRFSVTTWSLPVTPAPVARPEFTETPASCAPVDRAQRLVHPGEPNRAAFEEEPLTAEMSRIHVTVSRRLIEKLDRARAILSHSRPGATRDEVIEAGLDLLIERHAKRRGLVNAPRDPAMRGKPSRGAKTFTRSRPIAGGTVLGRAAALRAKNADTPGNVRNRPRGRIPAHVQREVWTRDQGRCQWKLPSGEICGSIHRVQIDHVVPVAWGGGGTATELRLLCDVHNDLAAREAFGDAWMDRFTRRGRVRRPDGKP